MNKKYWFNLKTIMGYAAMWALRQSPYNVPEDLEFVIKILHCRALAYTTPDGPLFNSDEMAKMDREEFKRFIQACLIEIPEVQKWNERKNGNKAPVKFVDRYTLKGNPDDDFIDLGALANNIGRELFQEAQRDHDWDQNFEKEWRRKWFQRWWIRVKQKLWPATPQTPCGMPPAPEGFVDGRITPPSTDGTVPPDRE